MDDFMDAKVLLEGLNAGIQVSDADSFVKKAKWFLEHPEALEDFGNRARQAAVKNRGAAVKHAKVVARLSESVIDSKI
jgi:hypothetical protein